MRHGIISAIHYHIQVDIYIQWKLCGHFNTRAHNCELKDTATLISFPLTVTILPSTSPGIIWHMDLNHINFFNARDNTVIPKLYIINITKYKYISKPEKHILQKVPFTLFTARGKKNTDFSSQTNMKDSHIPGRKHSMKDVCGQT
jgi:hypothetical protein